MIYTITLNPALDYDIYLSNFVNNSLNESREINLRAGGKGIIVSKMLKKLGISSIALGFVSGFTGEYIKDDLSKDGIKNDFVQLSDESFTRINIKINDKNGETEISGISPRISSEELDELMNKLKDTTKEDFLVLSGSVPSSISKNIYKKISKNFKGKVFLDTRGELISENVFENTFFVKPNINELKDMFGVKEDLKNIYDISKYIGYFFDKDVDNVIVSDGGKGAYYFNKDEFLKNRKGYFIKPPKGQYINSIGSGDSVVAGFLAGIYDNKSNLECFKQAVACGTATAYSYGIGELELIEKLKKEIEIVEYEDL